MQIEPEKLGVSKKTNIAIAAMVSLSTAQGSWQAILAITLIACLGICIQGWIDYKKINAADKQ